MTARPDLAKGFAAAGDGALQVVLGASTESRRIFEQALPNFREVEKWDEAAAVLREIMTAYAKLAGVPAPQPNANKK